ncbi:hypothetical protein ACB092_12G109200 [Castanea dentata]
MSEPTILLRRTTNRLPEEIVSEILVRLPVKSLLRFRCVCKSWYCYVATPNFINNSLPYCNDHSRGFFIHMPKTTGSMVSSSRPHGQICTVASQHTFEAISELRIPFTFQSGYPHFVGSCNGILCFSDYTSSEFKDVYLWNPSIRKFKRLPDTCLSKLFNVSLGFGFDSQNNNYKVVRISVSTAKPMPPPDVEVYSLSSDSWKRVGLGISWRPNIVFHKFNCTLTFPFVSGRLHWMIEMIEGGGQERLFTSMILSFDVNSEKFKELPLPDDEGSCITKCLASFKEKLALIKFGYGVQPHSLLCSIWVMGDSWNKLRVLPIENLTDFIGFTNCGLLLVQKRSRLDSSNSELKRNKSVLIDPETLHEKEIQVDYRLDVAAYMENLALLDGANVLSY